MLVQGQVGNQLLELPVLIPQLAQLPDLRRAEAAVLLLPAVERLLGDLELAADLDDRRAGLDLPQGHGDLFLGELARLHGRSFQPQSEASG